MKTFLMERNEETVLGSIGKEGEDPPDDEPVLFRAGQTEQSFTDGACPPSPCFPSRKRIIFLYLAKTIPLSDKT